MRTMRRLAAVWGLVFAAGAACGVTVSDVSFAADTARGDITVSYTLDEAAYVTFDALTNGVALLSGMVRTVSGDSTLAEGAGKIAAGRRSFVWNAGYDVPDTPATAFTIRVKAYSDDGLAAVPGCYMVVDISNRSNYTVSYTLTPPDFSDPQCWTNARATQIWLKRIEPGTFLMGSPETELGRQEYETQRKVTITEPYFIGIFETTQTQYIHVVGSYSSTSNAETWAGRPFAPATGLSFRELYGSSSTTPLALWPTNNAVTKNGFIDLMRKRTGDGSFDFSLPTEAQWEYACRAGTQGALYTGGELDNENATCTNSVPYARTLANNNNAKIGGYSNGPAVVGSYTPNAWGLYDMLGNVWEYTLNWWPASFDDTSDLCGPRGYDGPWKTKDSSINHRTRRGGSCGSKPCQARCARRDSAQASFPADTNGFRLLCRFGVWVKEPDDKLD